MVEQEFAIEVPISDDRTIAYIGSWDRIDLTPDGIQVVELKSSDSGTFAPNAAVQLLLYMYAFEKLYNVRPTRGILESIATGKQKQIVMTNQLMDLCENLIVTTVALLQNKTYTATPSVSRCSTCKFNSSCPVSEV
jgi:CRISPR/Cas system-associated exonuclease Cas4 (RecB family)